MDTIIKVTAQHGIRLSLLNYICFIMIFFKLCLIFAIKVIFIFLTIFILDGIFKLMFSIWYSNNNGLK